MDNSGDNHPQGLGDPTEMRQLARCLIYVQRKLSQRSTPISCGLTGFFFFSALLAKANRLGEARAYVIHLGLPICENSLTELYTAPV